MTRISNWLEDRVGPAGQLPDMVAEPHDDAIDQVIEMVPMAAAGIRAYWQNHNGSRPKPAGDRARPGRGRGTGRR